MSGNKRRILAVWLSSLATDRLLRAWPEVAGRPVAVVAADKGGLRLVAANEEARRAGAEVGLTVSAARAVAPLLLTFAADARALSADLERLAAWACRYTPWAAPYPPDGLALDITGAAHLMGGEEALARDLLARLKAMGLAARLALADTAGAAWGLARFGADNPGLVAVGGTAAALAPLPLAALRLEVSQVEDLHRLGLRSVGDLLGRPRAPLAARFGPQLVTRLDQALGAVEEPVSPLAPVPERRVLLAFPEPIGLLGDIEAACAKLLASLSARLETLGLGARRLDLMLYHCDGRVSRVSIGTARPSRDAEHLARLFRGRLAGFEAGFGVDAMALEAAHCDAFVADQGRLGDRFAGPPRSDTLAALVDRLTGRLGERAVQGITPQSSHWPERAWMPCAPLDAVKAADDDLPPRPLVLFDPPQPVRVESDKMTGQPQFLDWRRRRHVLARTLGPERIAPQWWRDQAPEEIGAAVGTRDYYRVEDQGGRRLWLYREQGAKPGLGWFLQGIFP